MRCEVGEKQLEKPTQTWTSRQGREDGLSKQSVAGAVLGQDDMGEKGLSRDDGMTGR